MLREGAAAAATATARPQPTCPLASRAGVKPQHEELPGGNDEGPPATQNISLQPSGAGRARHEPPARSAPRSRPRRVRVRAPARGQSRVRLSVRQVRAARSLCSRPASRPGTEEREERVRGGGGASLSPRRSVSQVLVAGAPPPEGLEADATAAGRPPTSC